MSSHESHRMRLGFKTGGVPDATFASATHAVCMTGGPRTRPHPGAVKRLLAAKILRRREPAFEPPRPESVLIRLAGSGDTAALTRLATLDSKRVPHGDVLVAELDGEFVVALPVDGGAVLADPFRYTADIVDVLSLRAQQLRAAAGTRQPKPRRWRRVGAVLAMGGRR